MKRYGQHFSGSVDGRDGSRYYFRSNPVFLDLDAREKHILETGYPEDGTFHICLIGWTHMTRQDIDDIGDNFMKRAVLKQLSQVSEETLQGASQQANT